MLTPQRLLDSGFKEYAPHQHLGDRWDRAFQKRVQKQGVTLYFVNVQMWDHRKYGETRIGWDSWADFYWHADGPRIRFTVDGIESLQPRELLRLFADAFRKLGCIPDPHNNDA